jgi:hypothetical protein
MRFLQGLFHREVLRTCLRCGTTWTVPKYYTKRHSVSWDIAPLSGTGGVGSQTWMLLTGVAGETTNRVTKHSTDSAQIRAQFGKCPECASNQWKQKRASAKAKRAVQHRS